MCNFIFSSCIFLSDKFELCGIFLLDFQPYSNQQGDVIHEIIKYLQLKQTRLQSLILQTQLSQTDIHPDVFRSMKYDCFLNVHINFGNDLFSTPNSFETPIQTALYKNALFLIFVKKNPHQMLTAKKAKYKILPLWQYRIFVFRIRNTVLDYNQFQEKSLVVYETFYLCPFCLPGLIRLNSTSNTDLSLKLSNFEKNWVPTLSQHFFQEHDKVYFANEVFCRSKNLMDMYNVNIKCQSTSVFIRLISFASGGNFTMKPYLNRYYDYLKLPQFFDTMHYTDSGLIPYFSSALKQYDYRSIIYCFNLGRVTVAEENMWTKYVPLDIWGLLGLCLLFPAIMNVSIKSQHWSVKFVLRSVVVLFNSFFKLIRISWRQSLSHKWMLLGVLELLFIILISVYENSITVSVVVPLVPKPLLSTLELYNNNYTFAVQTDNSPNFSTWMSNEYNTVNHRRVKFVQYFWHLSRHIECYFLRNQNGTKHAIVGFLSKHYHFKLLKLLKEDRETCYQVYPTEAAFQPEPNFYAFASAAASLLTL